MTNHDPFSFNAFGNTALSSGLGIGHGVYSGTQTLPEPQHANPAHHPPPAKPASRPARKDNPRPSNYYLAGDRGLAKGWKARARGNLDAIVLSAKLADEGRQPTSDEQARLARFTGFGASELANAVFRRPGEDLFRKGWEEIGGELQDAVTEAEYASLTRCTQDRKSVV